jgi:hypothetical protein
MLIVLVFWLGVKDTAVGDSLVKNWAKVLDCVTAPFSCSAQSASSRSDFASSMIEREGFPTLVIFLVSLADVSPRIAMPKLATQDGFFLAVLAGD